MNPAAAIPSLDPATLLGWASSYLVHSTLLMALALLASRYDARLEESLWRLALVGAAVTATAQTLIGGNLWHLPVVGAPTAAAVAPQSSAPPAAAMPAAPVSVGPSLAEALTLLWMAIATLLALRWIGTRLRLHRHLAGRHACDDRALLAEVRELAATAGLLTPPRLTLSDAVPCPIAFGWTAPEICIPSSLTERLEPATLRAVLAHEIAHLRRRDSAWMGLLQLTGAVLFFQPFFGPARRRLAQLAELACDRWSASVSGSGVPLARGLTTVARLRVADADTLPLPGLALRRSGLGLRIDALLGEPTSASLPRWLRRSCTAAALAGVVLVTPGLTIGAQEPPSPSSPPEPEAPATLRYPAPPSTPSPAPSVVAQNPSAPGDPDVAPPPSPPEPAPGYRLHRLEAEGLDESELERLETEMQARLDAVRQRVARSEAERRARLEAIEAERRARFDELRARDEEERHRLEAEMAARLEAEMAARLEAEMAARLDGARERLERSEQERRARLEAMEAERRARHDELGALRSEQRDRLQAEMDARSDAARQRLERSEDERRARIEAIEAERRIRHDELRVLGRDESRRDELTRERLREELERRRQRLQDQQQRLRREQQRLERELERLEAEGAADAGEPR
jgi:beta-lactamase regulating signal transducer with metallopeptidase domain